MKAMLRNAKKTRSSAIAETAGVTIRSVILVNRLILTVTPNVTYRYANSISNKELLICEI